MGSKSFHRTEGWIPGSNCEHVVIICEGFEEADYIDRLTKCGVWRKNVSIKVINAESISRIAPLYRYWCQKSKFDRIVIFCDTEIAPYDHFRKLIDSITKMTDGMPWHDVVFYVNPCTLQLVLSHFGRVKLKTNDKHANAAKIEELTGVENYRADGNQRRSIMEQINAVNYEAMRKNISPINMGKDYTVTPGTNALDLFDTLE